ncbi:response regulator [Azospirillum picis]|uniref:CheY-like chemotaxis protein n=1 Tax=Azospirillum picis TaxID=488438 RepID=A0ABU0MMS1_9PROT|nr:response regulator [Azospirillum picis]MBP2300497.1 CheY-like chemotaxis protein [Azospirillum picis]MDQ0534466.1 CheY-like chemotaxis protein [Azospirillum picis]
MPDYDFSQIDAAIIDSQLNTGRLFRDVLIRMNFRRAEVFDSVRAAAGLLVAGMPDLLLVDADAEDSEAFRFIRSLRNDSGVPNPFACVIVTTWTPTPALLARVSNVGGDDLLMKPVSPKQMRERIVSLIEARKGFVVTADYTGPDRRKAPREGAQIPVLDAPNTLRLKATGQWTQSGARMLLNEAVATVACWKRLRASIQIAFLAEFALPGLARPVPDRLALDHLARIAGFADDLLRRLGEGDGAADAGDHAPVEAVAHAVKALAETIGATAEAAGPAASPAGVPAADLTVDLAQLQALTRALMQAVDPDRPLDAMVREVAAAVSSYRGRLEQMALAKAAAASSQPALPAEAADAMPPVPDALHQSQAGRAAGAVPAG